MFRKLSYTWQLMGASWQVLKADKELVLFPLMSGIACILVLASFAVPIFLADAWKPPTGQAEVAQKVIYYSVLFAFYFVNYFVITFFNTAIIACAIERMRGGNPTIGYGIGEAMSRIHLIAGWALLSATIGLVLRVIEDRSEKIGAIVAGLIGMAFSVLSFLVVPILVVEQRGPIDALKESSRLLKRTWGEQLAGNFGFGMVFGLLSIPAMILFVVAFVIYAQSHSIAAAVAIGGLAVVYMILLSLVQSALQSIYQAAVYLYVTGGQQQLAGPRGFPVELLSQSMAAK